MTRSHLRFDAMVITLFQKGKNMKKLTLIGETSGFMVNSVKNGLTKAGYEVISVSPELTAISRLPEKTGILLIYLDGKMLSGEELFVYIRDDAVENHRRVFLIGSREELEEARKKMPGIVNLRDFERPFNLQSVLEALEREFEEEKKALERKKILIVDDNPTMLQSFKRMLESKYRVFIANSGINAFTFLGKTPVDLILLDYEMPVANGPQVLEMIRSEPSMAHIPVMFLTAKSDRGSVMSVISLKPEKYLLKTMPPAELIRNIDEFFEAPRHP